MSEADSHSPAPIEGETAVMRGETGQPGPDTIARGLAYVWFTMVGGKAWPGWVNMPDGAEAAWKALVSEISNAKSRKIAELNRALTAAVGALTPTREALTAANAQITELRAAIEPFLADAGEIEDDWHDNEVYLADVSVGQVRRVAKAYNQSNPQDKVKRDE